MAGGDDLVEDQHQQVGVRAGEDGDVHGHGGRVRLVEAHAEVALPRQQQQDEHPDVHQPHARCRTVTYISILQ